MARFARFLTKFATWPPRINLPCKLLHVGSSASCPCVAFVVPASWKLLCVSVLPLRWLAKPHLLAQSRLNARLFADSNLHFWHSGISVIPNWATVHRLTRRLKFTDHPHQLFCASGLFMYHANSKRV